MVTIIQAMNDPQLFARWFRGDSWFAWRVVLKAMFHLPMSAHELETYQAATGRISPPSRPVTEAWLCIGRRGGKSLVSALVCVYLACFRDYSKSTAPGEVVTVMLVAADRRQARTVMRYCKALIFGTPLLASLVINETQDSVALSNAVVIEIHIASRISTRSYTLGAVINDDISFFPSEDSANADEEILAAQRPSLSTIPGSLMVNVSSPYARRGAMYKAYEAHYAKEDSPVLYWKAPSRAVEEGALVQMNPKLDADIVRAAYEADASAASAEWGACFRTDTELMFTIEMLEAVTDYDLPEIVPVGAEI